MELLKLWVMHLPQNGVNDLSHAHLMHPRLSSNK